MRSFVASGLISELKKRHVKRIAFTRKNKSSRIWWMFNIRCCLFEILSLWLDQKIQMIKTSPPKHPQSDEQTTPAPEGGGKKHICNLFIYFFYHLSFKSFGVLSV